MRITFMAAGIALVAMAGLADEVTVRASRSARDCSDVSFRTDERALVRGEERLTVGGGSLVLRLGEGHGIPLKVEGGDSAAYEVLLCKAAEESGALAAVRLEQKGNEVSVVGPALAEWRGSLLVRAPRNGDLRIESSNGPVAVADLAGRLQARVINGPLALERVGGRVDVRATNGPISFTGGSGDVSLTTENGPISIRLENATWEGGELRSAAKNGPVTLKIPQGYASGIAVERGARAPFRCPTELCGPQPPFFEDDRTHVEIGPGAPRVHLAAKNGPISIRVE